ncbi:RluA family pseudouridine synthase [Saccharibacillus sp. JS10]|uniref:RluA family pseudouridine synthase n=1 Tax=Saccharibacillus sp. JS10 TaxID=2950552 RepID=UPI00210D91C3|nr:RluA family pseudouridine synthase [Saccharibacillus sp. JS10]MCQ4086092.1 RluA family pseudouridine synthase [Saccharibacillus sp. JS10]
MNDQLEEETQQWEVTSEYNKQRIDKYVTEMMNDEVSRSQIQLWIEQGHVTVNDRTVKSNHKVSVGENVEVRIPEAESVDIVAEDLPLEIVYEDSDMIVVNKARGMVVHPAVGHSSGTLVNALMFHCKDLSGINGEIRPGIVHRIDKDTSGLLMAAKNDKAHTSLAEQLKEHSVTRIYKALVRGNIAHDHGTVEANLARDTKDRKMYTVVSSGGKHAITHFNVVERFGDYSLLELKLETGRTHQIRAHMKFIGHPLVGDPMYGNSGGIKMQGQALHAATLGFTHPTSGERLEFSAPMPDDMEDLLNYLRNR